MTIPAQAQRLLTSNLMIIPTVIVVGGLFWVYQMIRRNKEQV